MRYRIHGTFASALFLSLLLSAPVRAGTVQGDNDYTIVPDQRIGPVALGQSDRDLFKLGVPDNTATLGKWTVYFYEDMKIFVDSSTHNVACIVLHDNDSYHLQNGVKIGSSLRDIESASGPPDRVQGNPEFGNIPWTVYYSSGNLWFSFGKENDSMADRPEDTVQEIGIQIPGAGLL